MPKDCLVAFRIPLCCSPFIWWQLSTGSEWGPAPRMGLAKRIIQNKMSASGTFWQVKGLGLQIQNREAEFGPVQKMKASEAMRSQEEAGRQNKGRKKWRGTESVVMICPQCLMIIFIVCCSLLVGWPDLKALAKARQYSKHCGRDRAQIMTLEPMHHYSGQSLLRQNHLVYFQEASLYPKRKDAMLVLSWKWAREGLLAVFLRLAFPHPVTQIEINKTNEMESCVINGQ